MRKSIVSFVLLCLCVILTGCDNSGNVLNSKSGTFTCTKSEVDEDGYSTESTIVATYKNDKISKVEETNISEMDPDYIEFTLAFGEAFAEALNSVDGLDIEYTKVNDNKIKYVLNADYSKINIDSIKDALGDLYEEDNTLYGNLDITKEDFKNTQVSDGYACK